MNYAIKKFGIVLLCFVLILVGLLVAVVMMSPPAFGGSALYAVAFAICWIAGTVYFSTRHLRFVSQLQRMTHAWYKATYPEAMKGSTTCCFGCGGDRMTMRDLAYHRQHICVDCGTMLYYSPWRT